jgi:polyisoprenoid-binding protein YceI
MRTMHGGDMPMARWLFTAGCCLLAAGGSAAAQEKLPTAYVVDVPHSRVAFRVRFMGLSTVKGEFSEFGGAILMDEDPTRSSVTVVIRTSSINTHARARDDHLRSPDFLDAEKHPAMVFRSTRVERSGSGFIAHGTLRMRGVSRTIALPFTQLHEPVNDAWRNQRVAFQGEIRLSRRDYGIPGTAFWNAEYDPGRFAVADSVDIELEISATIPNTARWTVPGTDSLVTEIERAGAERVIAQWQAGRDSAVQNNPNVLFVSAYKLVQRGQRDAAILLFEWVAARFARAPQLPLALGVLGETYLAEGRRADAVRTFERVLAADPLDPRALEWLSRLGARDRTIPGS